jgi:prenyltransferase beta subunit
MIMKSPATWIRLLLLAVAMPAFQASGQAVPLIDPRGELPEALNGARTMELVRAVDRGLVALQRLQQSDGSFYSSDSAQPGITSLAVMAYLSRGHKPGQGPYGESLNKAIDYVVSQQKKSGLFSSEEINHALINVEMSPFDHAVAAKTYNHAISMLMLGEVYGLLPERELFRLRNAIEEGLKFTIQLWDIRKGTDREDGGFRYTRPWEHGGEGDMSVTGWHAASLRSIRNAGFDVPQSVADRIADFVVRNQTSDGGFGYATTAYSGEFTTTAAGTLCLALAGRYDHPATRKAATFLSRFDADNRSCFRSSGRSWPYYTCYYVTQASIQVGGRVWLIGMRECADYLLRKQNSNGHWPPDGSAATYGEAYSTSTAIIALTPCLQLLPIYQR